MAGPTPDRASWPQSMMAEVAPAVRPTAAAAQRRAASSQNRKPRPMEAPRPTIMPRELRTMDRPPDGWSAGASSAGASGRSARARFDIVLVPLGRQVGGHPGRTAGPGRQAPGHDAEDPDVVEETVEGEVGDPTGLAPLGQA